MQVGGKQARSEKGSKFITIVNNFQMKNIDKPQSKKKQKPTFFKATSTGNLFKKPELKKLQHPKKQDSNIPTTKRSQFKSPNAFHSINDSNPKSLSTANSATKSVKMLPISARLTPKSGVAEFNSLAMKKKINQNTTKTSLTKTPSKISETTPNKVKQQVKKSLANVIKVYHPIKNTYLDVSMTEDTKDCKQKQDRLARADFNFLTVIGEGGYGKVWKVEHLKSRVTYAMKQMSKAVIIMKKSAENVLNQMKILSKLKSPFIANMSFAFNDRDNLYLGMDYLPGGDLRTFLSQSQKLTQQQSRFVIACIIKSVQYIHQNKIFHRDIKPENLVIDESGYVRLTDFGIARNLKQKQVLDASGTPGYMAPEVLNKQIHSYPVDYYAIGVIAYELMMGKRPYSGQNRIEIKNAILSKQHSVKKTQIPGKWSLQSADFINKLILRKPQERLGSRSGIDELKQHAWFNKFPWKQLEFKKLMSPFKVKYLKPKPTERMEQYEEAINQFKLLQRTDEKVDVFANYYFGLR